MPEYRSSTGVVRKFELDVEGLIEAEMKDPKLRFVRDYAEVSRSARVSVADRILRALGTTYAQFIADGFVFNDLGDIMMDLMPGLGFSESSMQRLDQPAPSTPTES